MRKCLLLATILVGTCFNASAKELNLLCLGNSFTQNATKYLPQIVDTFPDCKLNLVIKYQGGSPLAWHWNCVETCEKNEADPKTHYITYKGKKLKTLKDLLQAEKWDVIVPLQQYGHNPVRFSDAEGEPYATNLYNYVKQYSPNSEIMVHQTWAFRGDWVWASRFKEGMYNAVNDFHSGLAKKFNIKMLPSGAAMKLAQERHPLVLDPTYDYKKPVYPNLPKEQWSLHIGPKWIPQKNGSFSYMNDDEHASPRAEYMLSCLWFDMLYGKDARTIKYKPDDMSDDEAKELRDVAHETATTFVQPAKK